MQNVTITDKDKNWLEDAPYLPEGDQLKKYIGKKYGPGKFYLNYRKAKLVGDATTGRKKVMVPTRETIWVEAAKVDQATPGPHVMAGHQGGADLGLYRELIQPMQERVLAEQAEIKALCLQTYDCVLLLSHNLDNLMAAEAEGQFSGEPGEGAEGEEVIPAVSARLAEAVQKYRSGVPGGQVMGEYMDLLPEVLGMMDKLVGKAE